MDAVIGIFLAFVGALAGGFVTRAILRARYGLARREVTTDADLPPRIIPELKLELGPS